MKAPVRTSESTYKIGTCPGCRVGVWADVTVKAEVNEPYLDNEGRGHASVSVRIVKVSFAHDCAGVSER